ATRESRVRSRSRAGAGRRPRRVLARRALRGGPRRDAVLRSRARGRRDRRRARAARRTRRAVRGQGRRAHRRARDRRDDDRPPLGLCEQSRRRARRTSRARDGRRRARARAGHRPREPARTARARPRRDRPDPRVPDARSAACRGHQRRRGRARGRRDGRAGMVRAPRGVCGGLRSPWRHADSRSVRLAARPTSIRSTRACIRTSACDDYGDEGPRVIETTAAPFPTLRLRPWLGIVAAASAAIATWMALVWAPTDAVQGDVYRVIYVHVPAAWLAYLAFFIVFLASVGWLWTRRPWFD